MLTGRGRPDVGATDNTTTCAQCTQTYTSANRNRTHNTTTDAECELNEVTRPGRHRTLCYSSGGDGPGHGSDTDAPDGDRRPDAYTLLGTHTNDVNTGQHDRVGYATGDTTRTDRPGLTTK